MTLEEAEELSIESAVIRVIDWENITENGKPVTFTKENAERIFKEYSWIKEAVMEESGQILNFRSE
jgi:glycerol-3-phosphate cytidylyltransferase-like family protein